MKCTISSDDYPFKVSDACFLIVGTDINRALLTAMSVLDKAERLPERSVSMIILLTDGQPTSGE